MRDQSQLRRVLSIWLYFENGGDAITLQGLATWCDVSTRTIRRDLEALESIGCGIQIFDGHKRGERRALRPFVHGRSSAHGNLSQFHILHISRPAIVDPPRRRRRA